MKKIAPEILVIGGGAAGLSAAAEAASAGAKVLVVESDLRLGASSSNRLTSSSAVRMNMPEPAVTKLQISCSTKSIPSKTAFLSFKTRQSQVITPKTTPSRPCGARRKFFR